jgi:hypothetical protein
MEFYEIKFCQHLSQVPVLCAVNSSFQIALKFYNLPCMGEISK